MPDLTVFIAALLAAAGAVALGWLIAGVCARADGLGLPATAVLLVSDESADVQRAVRRLNRLRRWGAADLKIILADGGMSPEARGQAEILLREDPALTLCALSEICQFIVK